MLINARAHKILSQIVTLHYATCEPVGSKLISRHKMVPLSPATIRNIMMRLETRGYLSQPHTSAGRLPTDLGYRTYVDAISFDRQPLSDQEKAHILNEISGLPTGPGLLKKIADLIRQQTRQMTFHIPLRQSGVKLRHIHLERLNREKLLVLWIARGGQTFETVLNLKEDDLNPHLLEKTENYFNSAFTGCNLLEIQRKLTSSPGSGVENWDMLLTSVALLTHALSAEAQQLADLSFQGQSKLLEMPEFQDVKTIKSLFEILENQAKIKTIVRQTLDRDALVLFLIGAELEDPELKDLTIALAKITHQNNCIGCVGVLGPKRMPYLKSLQMLSFARAQVDRLPA